MPDLDAPVCRWLGQWQDGASLEVPDLWEPPPGWQNPAPADCPCGAMTFDPRADAGRVDGRALDVRQEDN